VAKCAAKSALETSRNHFGRRSVSGADFAAHSFSGLPGGG